MLLFPNCKINIGLDILSKRPDGFHDIQTVMIPVYGLTDGLEIIKSEPPGARFSSSGLEIDCPSENNLVLKAYEIMHREYGVGGVKIHLHKAIPFGAGLGGGSADAAFTVAGIDRLFDLNIPINEQEKIAGRLGSDTPFFVRNYPRLCSGRGEVMSDLSLSLKDKYVLIVKPDFSVSTAEAYSGVIPRSPQIPLHERIRRPVSEWKDSIGNGFEDTVFLKYPSLAEVKSKIYSSGALYASMSGSGSAMYGIFDHEPDYAPAAGEQVFVSRL